MDGSDDEADLNDSLNAILHRDAKTSFEVAPEFKLLPRDVTVDAPANVKLTCTLIANPEPQIQWTKNDTIEISPNEKYNMVYKNHLCTFEILRTHPTDSGTYTITATNSHGCASCSAKVSVRGLEKPGTPSQPSVTVVSNTSVMLKWDEPSNTHQVPVDAYSVQFQELDSIAWENAIVHCPNTSTVVDDLVPGKIYHFRVIANNNVGMSEESIPSEPVDLTNLSENRPTLSEIRWKERIEDDYTMHSELGRGRYSIVKKCINKTSNIEYAAKIVKRRMLTKEDVESEIAVLQSLHHPSVVKIHEMYDAPKGLVIVEQL